MTYLLINWRFCARKRERNDKPRRRRQPTRGVDDPVKGTDMANTSDWVKSLTGVEKDDPAVDDILAVLGSMKLLYGLEIEDPAIVARAVETGRRRYETNRWREEPEPRTSLVYYLRVGPFVKIGTTTDLPTRLKAYPPDAVVLAVEDGDRKVEHRRHKQFRSCLAERNEWFHPSAELIEHINGLRDTPLTAADLAA